MILVLAQLVGTLFTGALYDGGGDTWHPFFHLAVGGRVEYANIGIEGFTSPTVIRGVVDLYAIRVLGNWTFKRIDVRGGVGYSVWRRWGTDSRPHKEAEGASTTLGVAYRIDPALFELRWEWFSYKGVPIKNALLLLLGVRFP